MKVVRRRVTKGIGLVGVALSHRRADDERRDPVRVEEARILPAESASRQRPEEREIVRGGVLVDRLELLRDAFRRRRQRVELEHHDVTEGRSGPVGAVRAKHLGEIQGSLLP